MQADTPKGKRRASPEAIVGVAVDAYLKTIGAYMRTIKSDGTKMPNGRWRKSKQGKGISDRIGVLPPNGRALSLELKAPGKKGTVTEAQWDYLYNVHIKGGIALLVDCVEDVKTGLTLEADDRLALLVKYDPRRKPVPQRNLEPLFP